MTSYVNAQPVFPGVPEFRGCAYRTVGVFVEVDKDGSGYFTSRREILWETVESYCSPVDAIRAANQARYS